MSVINRFKPFNVDKKGMPRLLDGMTREDQPDAPFWNIPREIIDIILCYCTIYDIHSILLICKQMYEFMDLQTERKIFQQKLNSVANFECLAERLDLWKWYKNSLRQRAYRHNDPKFLIEYFGSKATPKKIKQYCWVDKISCGFIQRYEPELELITILEFDADAILKYFIEVFEESEKDNNDEWKLLRDENFHSFLWNLLVAYANQFVSLHAVNNFKNTRVYGQFVEIFSKYSHIIVRIFLSKDYQAGSISFPIMKNPASKLLNTILQRKICPMDLTGTFPRKENSSVPLIYHLTPLELCCYATDLEMFKILSQYTPLDFSAGYFAAVARSPHGYNQPYTAQLYDELIEKKIDLNAKVNPILRSETFPWIETVLGFACFDYHRVDSAVLIEWLLMHKARFSENELEVIKADPKLREKVVNILEVINESPNYNTFDQPLGEWDPIGKVIFSDTNSAYYLNLNPERNFNIISPTVNYRGKWRKSEKDLNVIICAAEYEQQKIKHHIRMTWLQPNPELQPSGTVLEYHAFMYDCNFWREKISTTKKSTLVKLNDAVRAVNGKVILVQERNWRAHWANGEVHPRMQDIQNVLVSIQ